jgi:hypothetical protein
MSGPGFGQEEFMLLSEKIEVCREAGIDADSSLMKAGLMRQDEMTAVFDAVDELEASMLSSDTAVISEKIEKCEELNIEVDNDILLAAYKKIQDIEIGAALTRLDDAVDSGDLDDIQAKILECLEAGAESDNERVMMAQQYIVEVEQERKRSSVLKSLRHEIKKSLKLSRHDGWAMELGEDWENIIKQAIGKLKKGMKMCKDAGVEEEEKVVRDSLKIVDKFKREMVRERGRRDELVRRNGVMEGIKRNMEGFSGDEMGSYRSLFGNLEEKYGGGFGEGGNVGEDLKVRLKLLAKDMKKGIEKELTAGTTGGKRKKELGRELDGINTVLVGAWWAAEDDLKRRLRKLQEKEVEDKVAEEEKRARKESEREAAQEKERAKMRALTMFSDGGEEEAGGEEEEEAEISPRTREARGTATKLIEGVISGATTPTKTPREEPAHVGALRKASSLLVDDVIKKIGSSPPKVTKAAEEKKEEDSPRTRQARGTATKLVEGVISAATTPRTPAKEEQAGDEDDSAEQQKSATKLQAIQRQKSAKKELEKKRQEAAKKALEEKERLEREAAEKERAETEAAAAKVQARIRGGKIRTDMEERKKRFFRLPGQPEGYDVEGWEVEIEVVSEEVDQRDEVTEVVSKHLGYVEKFHPMKSDGVTVRDEVEVRLYDNKANRDIIDMDDEEDSDSDGEDKKKKKKKDEGNKHIEVTKAGGKDIRYGRKFYYFGGGLSTPLTFLSAGTSPSGPWPPTASRRAAAGRCSPRWSSRTTRAGST